jgi:hypothetical protein
MNTVVLNNSNPSYSLCNTTNSTATLDAEDVPRFSTPAVNVCWTPNIPSIIHNSGALFNVVVRDRVSYNAASLDEAYEVVNVEGFKSTDALGVEAETIGCIDTIKSRRANPRAEVPDLLFIDIHLLTT